MGNRTNITLVSSTSDTCVDVIAFLDWLAGFVFDVVGHSRVGVPMFVCLWWKVGLGWD